MAESPTLPLTLTQEREQGRPEDRPLLVVAPMAMRAWLREAASSLDGVGAHRSLTLALNP